MLIMLMLLKVDCLPNAVAVVQSRGDYCTSNLVGILPQCRSNLTQCSDVCE